MINGKIIKVCGMREGENIQAVETLESIDMLGFIFYPRSARYVCQLPDYLPTRALRVGVFVNEEEQTVMQRVQQFGLHYVQLHGNESPQHCNALRAQGVKVIKVFSIACADDIKNTSLYDAVCDFFLFDTRCEEYGGSGKQFDWEILQAYQGSTPFLLSGGIHTQSAPALQTFDHPRLAGYDLNSRFEVKPAEKDREQLLHFFNEVVL